MWSVETTCTPEKQMEIIEAAKVIGNIGVRASYLPDISVTLIFTFSSLEDAEEFELWLQEIGGAKVDAI